MDRASSKKYDSSDFGFLYCTLVADSAVPHGYREDLFPGAGNRSSARRSTAAESLGIQL